MKRFTISICLSVLLLLSSCKTEMRAYEDPATGQIILSENGKIVLQHYKNPLYPGEYIQYPDLSLIQPAFPASGIRYELVTGVPLVLRYRLFIHSGMKPGDALAEKAVG
jgi:hypothetical protein